MSGDDRLRLACCGLHPDRTRRLLAEVPVRAHVQDMQSQVFAEFVANHENLWVYCSNVMLFAFFDLCFHHPQNAVLFTSYYDENEILDLGGLGGGPVTVHCRIPMSVAS